MSGVITVQVCTAWTPTPKGFMACRELAQQQAYLIPPETAGYVDVLVNGGFSLGAFGVGTAGALGSFVTGLLIDWVTSLLYKIKQGGNTTKAMKQHIAKFSPVASFHNLYIADSVTVATSLSAFAGVTDANAVESAITDGQGGMKVIGGYVVGALVALTVAGLVYSMLHKT